MPPNRLTERGIVAIAAGSKPAKHSDGDGLYLLVNPNGSRYWRFNYRFGGKRNTLSLGVYPTVSIQQARETRDQLRIVLANGLNPSNHRKIERAEQSRQREEQRDAARFLVDSTGALSVRLGNRTVLLNAAETIELRAFLDATKSVARK